MRVLHWYPNFLAGGGVAANAVVALATAQRTAGADVWIATYANDSPLYGALPTNGVLVEEWSGWGSVKLSRQARFHVLSHRSARTLRAIKPDVVHIHGEFNPNNWWVPRRRRCPLVLSPHGCVHEVARKRGARRKACSISVTRRALYRHVSWFHALTPTRRVTLRQCGRRRGPTACRRGRVQP